MKWTRPEPGEYTAGPYKITRWMSAKGSGTPWFVDGPGVQIGWHATKDDAQAEAEDAALMRITEETKYSVEPVVGDWAYLGEYLQVTAVFNAGTGPSTYSLRTARGKRKCLRRYEFPLVIR